MSNDLKQLKIINKKKDTVPAMKRAHELEEPILSQLLGLEKNQAYHVYADPWGYVA